METPAASSLTLLPLEQHKQKLTKGLTQFRDTGTYLLEKLETAKHAALKEQKPKVLKDMIAADVYLEKILTIIEFEDPAKDRPKVEELTEEQVNKEIDRVIGFHKEKLYKLGSVLPSRIYSQSLHTLTQILSGVLSPSSSEQMTKIQLELEESSKRISELDADHRNLAGKL